MVSEFKPLAEKIVQHVNRQTNDIDAVEVIIWLLEEESNGKLLDNVKDTIGLDKGILNGKTS